MALPQGIDFRSTSAYVTDPTNCDYEISTGGNYPRTSAQGNTVGWESTGLTTRNRNSGNPANLAGVHISPAGTVKTYRVDLPSTGSYNVRLAAGDATYANPVKVELFDDTTSLGVLASTTPTGANKFRDATNAEHTAANWEANNTAFNASFASTICRIKNGSASSCVISHFLVESAGGSGAATVIPIGVSTTGSVGVPTATGAARVTPAGVSAASAVGTPTATGGTSIPATVTPAGVSAAWSVGTPAATGAAIATPSGVQANSAVGTPAAFGGTSIPATVIPAGVAALSYVGTPTATGAAIAYPAGVSVTAFVGTPTASGGISGAAIAYPSGVQAIGSVGTMIATGAAWCSPGGVQAVGSVGTPVAQAGVIEVYIPGAMAGRRMAVDSTRPARIQTGIRPAR